MARHVKVPRLFATSDEATLSSWLKQQGDEVQKDEDLFEIQTDKVNVVVAAPVSGKLAVILVNAPSPVHLMQSIGVIAEPGDSAEDVESFVSSVTGKAEPAKQAPSPALSAPDVERGDESRHDKVLASPAARRIAQDLGIDVGQVKGTGPGGRITREDVEKHLRTSEDQPVALEGTRKRVAEQVSYSAHTAAQVTLFKEINITSTVQQRESLLQSVNVKGIHLTLTHFGMKAAAMALSRHPALNAVWDEEKIILKRQVNLGMACALDEGLIVPVIHDAGNKSLVEVARCAGELAARARTGTLSAQDLEGGTFTVTSLGSYGVHGFTPIINPPQVAILGLGEVVQKVLYVGGVIMPCYTQTLSLTFDHRAMDGVPAARFLADVARILESGDYD